MEHAWKVFVVAWICCTVAACVSVYFIKSVWCMWVLILPCFYLLVFSNNDKDNNDDKK